MRGRKPDNIITGTSSLTSAPKAPVWLSTAAKNEWRRVAPILVERGVLTDADLGVLESYVTAVGLVRDLSRQLKKDGLVIDTPAGLKRHPAIGAQNSAMTTARQCAAELGLTPVSRSRPGVRDQAPDDLAFLD